MRIPTCEHTLTYLHTRTSLPTYLQGRIDTVESELKTRIAKREENINVKKRGLPPTPVAGAADTTEKIGECMRMCGSYWFEYLVFG